MSLLEERCSYIQHVVQNQGVLDSAWLGPSSEGDFPFMFMARNICNTAQMLLGYPHVEGWGLIPWKHLIPFVFLLICVYMRRRGSIVRSFSVWEVRSLSPSLSSCRVFSLYFSQSLCVMFSHYGKKYLEIIFSIVYMLFRIMKVEELIFFFNPHSTYIQSDP